jgi:diguanylate cyclase (GGDEF)-like protein
MLDVDFFKRFNDHYGHQAGDDCLRTIAQTIKATLKRPYDLLARYGGEEFACVLPQTNGEGAIFIAEQVLANINALQLAHADSDAAQTVTISIGLAAMLPSRNRTPDELIKAADQQLYIAKENGRARFVSIDLDKASTS